MNQLYRTLGISKQGFHQWKKRQSLKSSNQLLVLEILEQVREDHPGYGCAIHLGTHEATHW